MARPLRIECEGAVYHLCARGNERQRVFRTEQDRAITKTGGYGLGARNVAMWLVCEQCGMSLREIGDFFGGLNYAAVAQRLRRLTFEDKQEAARLLSKCQKI